MTALGRRAPLLETAALQESHDEVPNTIEVPAVNADNLVAEFKLGCLHLDMEGGEIAVLDTVDLTPIRKVFLETHPYAYQPGDFERVVKRLRKHGFEPIFLGNPFGTSFPEQSSVMGFAMRGELAERLKARVPAGDDGIFQRIEIEVHGDNVNVQVIE